MVSILTYELILFFSPVHTASKCNNLFWKFDNWCSCAFCALRQGKCFLHEGTSNSFLFSSFSFLLRHVCILCCALSWYICRLIITKTGAIRLHFNHVLRLSSLSCFFFRFDIFNEIRRSFTSFTACIDCMNQLRVLR